MAPEQEIYENAVRVLEGCRPLSGLGSRFGYNRESVEWLDGHIERLRGSGALGDEEQIRNLAAIFGCFLGECLRANCGGVWRDRDGAWGVFFPDGSGAFPLGKVRKQFDSGREGGDSILQFFDFVEALVSGRVVEAEDLRQASLRKRVRATLGRWFAR